LRAALANHLSDWSAKYGIPSDFHFHCRCDEDAKSLSDDVNTAIYRIAQEAMHNTVKHAHATHVDLRLEQTPGEIKMEIRDNGVGFDPTASFPGHLGLQSMRERVTNLGGTFQIESMPGQGTTLRACVPEPLKMV